MSQTREGLGTLRRPARLLDEPLEQASSSLDVTRGDVVLRSGGQTVASRGALRGRREVGGSLGRPSRGLGSASLDRRASRVVEGGRHVGVGSRGCARQVGGPLLGFGDDVGQPTMARRGDAHPTPARTPRPPAADG